ncbi:MAG TPA: hypothetical protein VMP10_01600 [Chloroflexota bacterium]|nr:hypothetical protein [Chloroflexota bacterium]
MVEQSRPSSEDDRSDERIPMMQRLYDNIWLLFLLSMVSVFGFYMLWGFIDLANVPTLP